MNHQPFLKKWKAPLAGAAIWLCLTSSYALAQVPQWWITRGVLNQNLAPKDYAPINQGQLKWLAISAYDEMNACFGAGSNVASVISAFSSSNNYFPVNIGQVKYLAAPFYDRLYEFDLTNTMPAGMLGHYPWDGRPETNDYAMVNIGQVKYVFSFDSAKDADGDGLWDWREAVYGTNPYNSDTDGDGLSDSWEVNHGYDPLDEGDANEAIVREAARQNILRHWMLFNGWRFEFTNVPGSAADLDDMKWALNLLSSKFYTVEWTNPTYETLYYHLNRAFTPVEIWIEGTPTVYQLYTESEKLTDIVKGLALQFNTNETYAIERNAAAICYTTAMGAWDTAIKYNNERHHAVKIFDNCGWVGGTIPTNGEWGAYFWTLQNHLAFRTSESNWWRHINPTGVFVEITNVFVGSIGNYGPVSNVVDIGPSLFLATNFPGADCGEAWEYKVDITNIFYQVAIPDIWITPRDTNTSVGGGNVQYTVTGANIPTGVTWAIIPANLTSGAVIQASNDWHYASVAPGNVPTNYKVRATSDNNTNFYDEVNLKVWKIDIVEINIYIAISNTVSLHLTPDSSVDAQWAVIPSVQDGANIQGSSVGTSVVINAGSIPTNYMVKAYAPDFSNCYDTCSVMVQKVDIVQTNILVLVGSTNNTGYNLTPDSYTNVTWTITPYQGTNGALFASGPTGAGTTNIWTGTNVWLSPGNVIETYTITAYANSFTNCRDTAAFKVLNIELEPVSIRPGNGGTFPLYNPCGIATGQTAQFEIKVDPSNAVDNADIVWTNTSGSVSFQGGNAGRLVTVKADGTGVVQFRVDIKDFIGTAPTIRTEGLNPTTVKARVYIIRQNDGSNAATTESHVTNLLADANQVFSQIAMTVNLEGSIGYTNRTEWLVADSAERAAIRDILSGTDGIEIYFVDELVGIVGANSLTGLVVGDDADFKVLAHEIGHACGLYDIYISEGTNTVTGSVKESWEPHDWNSGPSPQYYTPTLLQQELIPRLLMYGYDANTTADIPNGSIYGVWYEWVETNQLWHLNLAPVGLTNPNMDRTPVHQ